MANSRPTRKKAATVTTFPPPDSAQTATAVEDPPEPATPFDSAPDEVQTHVPPKGRPRKDAVPVETNFFARVAAVPAADWGTRVYLYLYQLEPVCDLKQSGGKSYLMRYQEPVRDEHQIMLEQGSGKYRLMLALNKITPNQSNEIAQHNFEIYNPQYPPKIPKEVWINDPRNRRWEALLPKPQSQPAAGSLENFVEVLRATNEMRREIKEDMAPETPAAAAQQQPAQVDPWSAAEKILNMRSENPMVAILQQQMKDAAAAQEAERQRAFTAAEAARDREFKLQQQLLEARSNTPPQKDFFTQLTELAAMGDKLDPIKKLFGFGNGGADAAGRVARTTGLDVVRDLVTGPAGATLAQGIGALISNLASATAHPPQQHMNPAPVVLNAQQPNGTIPPVEHPEQRIQRIGQQITRPMLTAFMRGNSGSDWAQSMFDLMPEDYAFMRALGAENIIERYRRFPDAWNIISFREAEFIEFIKEFCAWDANEDPDRVEPVEDAGITDLEGEQGA